MRAHAAIAIMYQIWGMLFSRLHKNDPVSHTRMAVWELIHFPLHLVLLLFLAAMVVSA